MSTMCVKLGSLVKVTDQEMFQTVLKAMVWPLMQINVPEHFLNLVEDAKPQTTAEKQMEKVQNTILPKHHTAAME